MIAPMSAHMEKAAIAVPDRPPPVASPTAAAGAVPRNAEATPYAQSATIRNQMLGAKGTARMATPAPIPAPDHCGPAADRVDEPSGGTDGDGLGHCGDGKGRAGPPRRPVQHLDHQHRHQRRPDAEGGPALGKVGEARRLVPRVADYLAELHPYGVRLVRPGPPGVQQNQSHGARNGEVPA